MKKLCFLSLVILICFLTALTVGCSSAPVGIKVLSEPTSLRVEQGTSLDLTGGEITVSYKNGDAKTLSMSELEITGVDYEALGTQTAILVYTEKGKSFSATLQIEVVLPAVLSLEIDDSAVKKDYIEGERFSTEGLKVTAHFSNGRSSELSANAYVVTPEVLTAETETVNINYRGKRASVAVGVRTRALTAIEITTPPSKTTYYVDENFDSRGMVVTAFYDNGDSVDLEEEVLSYVRADGSAYVAPIHKDDAELLVRYKEWGIVRTCSLLLTVQTHLPTALSCADDAPVECYAYEPFDVESIPSLYVTFDGVSSEVVPTKENFSVSDEPLSLGQESVRIWLTSYPDITLDIAVEVKKDLPVSSLITQYPKQIYNAGDAPDLTDLALSVTFSSGRTRDLTAEDLTAEESVLTMETVALHVLYRGDPVAEYRVDVLDDARELDAVELAEGSEVKTSYFEGEAVEDLTEKDFLFAFTNGDSVTVTPTAETLSFVLITNGEETESDVILAETTAILVRIDYTDEKGKTFRGEYRIELE
ncbi:MAG: bacterial Ig-like domain-containing protein [Clostridia bacterium]|nr:bacterial Ig-like domain-containing protein [Clostridia bacterium]